MKKMTQYILVFVMAVITIGALSAAGQTEKKQPDKVIVYSSVDQNNTKKLLDAFTADTGVSARFMHLSSGDAFTRIDSEKKNPLADVWLGAPNENHILAMSRGLTLPYKSGALDKMDGRFKNPDGYWYSFYLNPIAFGVNTGALAKANAPLPVSWEDLLRPEYKGLIQMPTPQSSGTGYNIIAGFIALWGEEKTFAYLKKLNRNIQIYTTSGTAPAQAAAVGQCAIAIQFTPGYFEFIEQGYPLKVIFPAEGVSYEAPAVSIIKGAVHLNAAKKLVDWLLSERGQEVLTHAGTFFYPVNPGVAADAHLLPFSSIRIIDFDPQQAAENKKRIVTRWVNEILIFE